MCSSTVVLILYHCFSSVNIVSLLYLLYYTFTYQFKLYILYLYSAAEGRGWGHKCLYILKLYIYELNYIYMNYIYMYT